MLGGRAVQIEGRHLARARWILNPHVVARVMDIGEECWTEGLVKPVRVSFAIHTGSAQPLPSPKKDVRTCRVTGAVGSIVIRSDVEECASHLPERGRVWRRVLDFRTT